MREAAVARFCSQDGRKRRHGASLHGSSMAFGAPSAAFLPLFALRRSFSGLFCDSGASREAPWSRFLPAREENAAVRPPGGVFCRGIAVCLGSIRRDCFRPVECKSSPQVVHVVASRSHIVALTSAKCRLCGSDSLRPETFLCRFVANTCGFLVRAHRVR